MYSPQSFAHSTVGNRAERPLCFMQIDERAFQMGKNPQKRLLNEICHRLYRPYTNGLTYPFSDQPNPLIPFYWRSFVLDRHRCHFRRCPNLVLLMARFLTKECRSCLRLDLDCGKSYEIRLIIAHCRDYVQQKRCQLISIAEFIGTRDHNGLIIV